MSGILKSLQRVELQMLQYSQTYAQIARSLVVDSQQAQPINKTSVPGVNTNGWSIRVWIKMKEMGLFIEMTSRKLLCSRSYLTGGVR